MLLGQSRPEAKGKKHSNTDTIAHPHIHRNCSSPHLTVSPVALGVEAFPGLPSAGGGLGVAVAPSETTGSLASGGQAAGFAVLQGGKKY